MTFSRQTSIYEIHIRADKIQGTKDIISAKLSERFLLTYRNVGTSMNCIKQILACLNINSKFS